jgi:hypothetical protein
MPAADVLSEIELLRRFQKPSQKLPECLHEADYSWGELDAVSWRLFEEDQLG